jgi:hypothetical protein
MSTSEPPRPDPEHPIVELAPNGDQQVLSQRTLELRIRQQEILAELGVTALQRTGFSELLDRAVQLAAEGLKAELCKILEYIPEEKQLLLRAGVGWDPA